MEKGKLTFKDGLKESFKIAVVFGITSPVLFNLYYVLINPEILNYVKNAYQMPDASNGLIMVIDSFAQLIAAIVFGTLYGAIITLFIRSKS